MPNHCSSDLRVNGSRKDIDAFFKAVKGPKDSDGEAKVIDANKIIPYPAIYAEMDKQGAIEHKKGNYSFKDGFNSGGYDWCVQNWGTKWGLYDFSEVTFGKTFALVSFQTAWSPPTPIILRASELFPSLTFTLRFYEMGAGYKGVLKVKAGKILADETTEYRGQRGG